MAVTVERTSVSWGEPMTVHIFIKNIGRSGIMIHRTGSVREYSFVLADDSGARVPLSINPHWSEGWSLTGVQIKPGELYERTLDLRSVFYKGAKPGAFTLTVATDIYRQFESAVYARLKSNPVHLKVIR
jgi:hypothetical protein